MYPDPISTYVYVTYPNGCCERFSQCLCIQIRYLLMYKVPSLTRRSEHRIIMHPDLISTYVFGTYPNVTFRRFSQYVCIRTHYLLVYTVPVLMQLSERFV